MNRFDHENLDVYQVAVDLVILIDEIVENLPRGRAYMADQFLRAGTSVVLNIALGKLESIQVLRRIVSIGWPDDRQQNVQES